MTIRAVLFPYEYAVSAFRFARSSALLLEHHQLLETGLKPHELSAILRNPDQNNAVEVADLLRNRSGLTKPASSRIRCKTHDLAALCCLGVGI